MKTRSAAVLVSLLLTAAAIPAVAHPFDPVIDARQARQAARIDNGVRSGALTPHETARLAAEQRAIRFEERAYKRDGVLTRFERADLRHDLNRARRDIRFQKHDGQRQF